MSTGSVGALGYDDDQDQSAWDAPGTFWIASGIVTGAVTSGPVDCSRWATLALNVLAASFPGQLAIAWATASSGGTTIAQRTIMVDPTTIQLSQLAIPNMGPWVTVTFTPSPANATWTPGVVASFTNRVRPASAYPQGPKLLSYNPASIAASATVTSAFLSIFPGPVGLAGTAGTTQVDLYVQYLDTDFTWQAAFHKQYAAAVLINEQLIIPFASCRVQVVNDSATTANTTFSCRVVPNLAGV